MTGVQTCALPILLVNDTRLTNGHGWSSSPDVNVDDDGNIHVVWVDGRSTIPSKVGPSQLHYMQIDLDRAGVLDGEADGLEMSQVAVVTDSAVIGSDMTWGSNPRVDFDNDGSIHITWFESMPGTDDENSRVELRWTRIVSPQLEDGEMPLGRTLEQAYGVINTRIIATSTDNLMGVFGTGLDSSSQPIVNFDWPDREIIWTTPDCSETSSSADRWDVCMWSENVYNMVIELAPAQPDEITLGPGESTNVEMMLRGIRVSGGSDIVITEAHGAPDDWFVDVGFSKSYQSTTTLIEGTTSDLDLFLRAPSLQEVNDDQTFHLTVTVTSSTKAEATTSKTILVNLVNEADWNDDDGDGILTVDEDIDGDLDPTNDNSDTHTTHHHPRPDDDCRVVPAATENQITSQNAERIKAQLIVEGANGPTTAIAARMLDDRGVIIVPDILANAGGVTVSYFEWVQNIQRFPWELSRVEKELEEILVKAYREVSALVESEKITYRAAAFSIAVDRVVKALELQGLP